MGGVAVLMPNLGGVPSYRTGVVREMLEERAGLQRVTVDLGDGPERAYVLTQLMGPVAVGDRARQMFWIGLGGAVLAVVSALALAFSLGIA